MINKLKSAWFREYSHYAVQDFGVLSGVTASVAITTPAAVHLLVHRPRSFFIPLIAIRLQHCYATVPVPAFSFSPTLCV